jgi:hypothetical protein
VNTLKQLKAEVEGHRLAPVGESLTGCSHPQHSEEWSKTSCWKARVNEWLIDQPEEVETESTDGLAQRMMAMIEGDDVILTNYVFVCEGLDADGKRAIYTAATDNIKLWDEMGLLHFALAKADAGMIGII